MGAVGRPFLFNHLPWRGLRDFLVGLLWISTVASQAQLPPDLLFTAATTTPAGQDNQALVYVTWSMERTQASPAPSWAVYYKPGGPSSSSEFTRLATANSSPSPERIAEWISLANLLNDNLEALESFLASILPIPAAPSVSDRIVAAIAQARSDSALAAQLSLASARHPILELASGQAWAGKLPAGVATFEIRDWDATKQSDRFVVSRLTIDVGHPTPLPPPTAPVRVPDLTPTGDLAARFRWGEDRALRHRAPLLRGFSLWRIPATAARGLGLDLRAPTSRELQLHAIRINSSRILVPRHLTPAQAADLTSDPITTFHLDRGENEPTWKDGSEFAWITTAEDALGNEGLPSAATFGFICQTRPPLVPSALRVDNHYELSAAGERIQHLVLRWSPDKGSSPEDNTRYEIFRGSGTLPPLSSTNAPDPKLRIGQASPLPGRSEIEFMDGSLDPFKTPALYGQTFWYAVRSVRESACGPIYSALCPPAFGTLRRFDSPEAPSGSLEMNCPRVVTKSEGVQFMPDPTLPTTAGLKFYRASCHRKDRGIAWVDLQWIDLNAALPSTSSLPIVRFGEDTDDVEVDFGVPVTAGIVPIIEVTAVAGSFTGANSAAAPLRFVDPPGEGQRAVGHFRCGTFSLAELSTTDPLAAGLLGPSFSLALAQRDTNGMVHIRSTLPIQTQILVQHRLAPNGVPISDWTDLGVTRVLSDQSLLFSDPLVRSSTDQSKMEYRGFGVRPNPSDGECVHVARPQRSRSIEGIQIRLNLTPRSQEFRVFRKVDDGPMVLAAQGAGRFNPSEQLNQVVVTDDGMPVTGARVCYFAQVGDEHGNYSPLAALGCVDIAAPEIPVPLLAAPEAEGEANQPVMRLKWFCAPEGIQRFVVNLAPDAGALPKQGQSIQTSGKQLAIAIPQPRESLWFSQSAVWNQTQAIPVRSNLLTGFVGAEMGEGPRFSLPLDVDPGVTYEVQVAAMDDRGNLGHASHSQRFQWKARMPVVDKNVPWPARPLPPVKPLDLRLRAEFLGTNRVLWPGPSNTCPVGIKIGSLPATNPSHFGQFTVGTHGGFVLDGFAPGDGHDPNRFLFTDSLSSPAKPQVSVLPVVLYRSQITNYNYRKVSGATVQVSPRLDQIAWADEDHRRAEILDPFVAVTPFVPDPNRQPGLPPSYELYLLDTHPVVQGAAYRYWLVHFGANGEPDRTIPAGEVEIP